MRVVAVDKQGHQRCWWCGGLELSQERITRQTVVMGIHANITKPTLHCEHCGEYTDLGRRLKTA